MFIQYTKDHVFKNEICFIFCKSYYFFDKFCKKI